MRVLKSINNNEFQKCGEIMVAAKKNKFAMSCKFCPDIFIQLQSFMRHLQLQHNDKLEFVKETEVYAFEELMNQTLSSCVHDEDSKESGLAKEDVNQWLDNIQEDSMKWLEDSALLNSEKETPELSENLNDKSDTLANISILKALEDCDVSFNLLDNSNDSTCTNEMEKNENIEEISNSKKFDILLRNIQADLEVNDCIAKSPQSNEELINKPIDMRGDIVSNKDSTKAKENYEETNCKGLRKLLESIDGLEDVDTLLQNLEEKEENQKTPPIKQVKELTGNILEKPDDLNANEKQLDFNTSKAISVINNEEDKNDMSMKDINNGYEDNIKVNEKNDEQLNSSKNSFLLKLNEIEALLEIDKADVNESISHTMATESNNNKEDSKKTNLINIENSLNLSSLQMTCTQPQKKLLNTGNKSTKTFSYNISFKQDLGEDFEFKLKNFEDSLNNENESENIQSSANEALLKQDLNEDLTKALADALDDDNADLLLYTQDEQEKPLNRNLLRILDQELNDKENNNFMPNIGNENTLEQNEISEQNHPPQAVNKINDILREILETEKIHLLPNNAMQANTKQKNDHNDVPNNIDTDKLKENYLAKNDSQAVENNKLKYRVTNLKAKHKLTNKQSCTVTSEHRILNEAKTILNNNQKNLSNITKGDHEVLKSQKQFQNTNKQVLQGPYLKQNCSKLHEINNKHSKTPIKFDKENRATTISQTNVRKEKLESSASFINTRRGERTPIKQEKIFLKQSPKTQEKVEKLPTSKSCYKTTPNKCLKPSPKIQENLEQLFSHKTPVIGNKNTPMKNKTVSPKNQGKEENLNITPPSQVNNKSGSQKKISPKTPNNTQAVARANNRQIKEKVNNVSPTEDKMKSGLRTSLTTPQRVRNLAVKLPKFTPEKLMQKIKSNEIKHLPLNTLTSNAESELKSTFKLPESVRIMKIPIVTQKNSNQNQTNEIVITPVKTDYCEQTSNAASLESTQKKEDIKENTHCPATRQRTPSIDILPASKEPYKTPRHNNLNSKSYAVSRTERKKEVLQRMRNIKKQIFNSIEYGGCTITKLPQQLNQKRQVHIESVQTLPATKNHIIKSNHLKDDEKNINKQSSNFLSDVEKLFKRSLKRPATSPLANEENPIKRPYKAQQNEFKREILKKPSKNEEKTLELNTTKLDLSNNVIEPLQGDLKAKEDLSLDDSSPNETSLESNNNNNDLIDDLLQQVHNEQNSKNFKESNIGNVSDFNTSKDIELLDKVGLKIIKQTDLEYEISLEELELMLEKSNKFADIYKCFPRLWLFKSTNESNNASQNELQTSLKQMLNKFHTSFKLQLDLSELKRLINLITFWYVHNINAKLIQKKNISEITNRFLIMFNFIPKTTRRSYFCEYCEKYFNTEHKYFCHRITHTGAYFPYTCQKCHVVGYKVLKPLKEHEKKCNGKETFFRCEICLQCFDTSTLLYQHSKKHLKTAYNCCKCELVFASDIDVKNHMAICNKSEKNIPKHNTPRPKQKTKNHQLN